MNSKDTKSNPVQKQDKKIFNKKAIDIKTLIKKVSKYQPILDNLLDIKGRDQAIFTHINNVSSYDIVKRLGSDMVEKLIKQDEFEAVIDETGYGKLIIAVKKCKDKDSIIDTFHENNEVMPVYQQELLEKSFATGKKKILNALNNKTQSLKLRWGKIIRNSEEIYMETNAWPLHIGFMLTTFVSHDKKIYAPLLFKKIILKIIDGQLIIRTTGDVVLNEKLALFMSQNGYNIGAQMSFNGMTFEEARISLGKLLGIKEGLAVRFNSELVRVPLEKIDYKKLHFHPGGVLGIFKPNGGQLRQTMLEIILHDKVEEVLNKPTESLTLYTTSSNHEQNEDYSNTTNADKNAAQFKIQPTNYSQDKAIISSLKQDTIIFGPPGTGKTQTISNILANIMVRGKSALVVSQKKAALEVLRSRLNGLSKFALFSLNDNSFDKKDFYKSLQEFVNALDFPSKIQRQIDPPLLNTKERYALHRARSFKKDNNYEDIHYILSELHHNIKKKWVLPTALDLLKKLDPIYAYPEMQKNEAYDKLQFLKFNKIKKNPITREYPSKAMEQFTIAQHLADLGMNKLNKISFKNLKDNIYQVSRASELNDDLLLNQKEAFKSDEDYLEYQLVIRIRKKILKWKKAKNDIYKTYLNFVKDIKRAFRIPYKFVHEYKDLLKELFPIIITTPESSFVEWKRRHYDYAIVDESSQMLIETGLPVLYLAKTRILAGDQQQMRPTSWFKAAVKVEADSKKETVDWSGESLLEYGIRKGVYSVMLDKNYRSSLASLMTFSSKHFYNSKLDVIDRVNNQNQGIEVLNVGGTWYKSTNKKEAESVIKKLKENMVKFETIIVLTLNSDQQDYIADLINIEHPKIQDLVDEGRLSIKNLENIQGDEADLVIISVVYDHTTRLGMTYVARPGGKNALNVAISRAKDKLIIIKSIYAHEVNGSRTTDALIFKRWLGFLDLKNTKQKSYALPMQIQKKHIKKNATYFTKEQVINTADYLTDPTHSWMKLEIDFSIGTKTIDVAYIDIDTNEFIFGLHIDTYDYCRGNIINHYLEEKSVLNYVRGKGYDVIKIGEIKWLTQREKIIDEITNKLKKYTKHKMQTTSTTLPKKLEIIKSKEEVVEQSATEAA